LGVFAAGKQQPFILQTQIKPSLYDVCDVNFGIALTVIVIEDYPSSPVNRRHTEHTAVYAEIIREREQIIFIFLTFRIAIPFPEGRGFIENKPSLINLP
jgi:hypothetical protein